MLSAKIKEYKFVKIFPEGQMHQNQSVSFNYYAKVLLKQYFR